MKNHALDSERTFRITPRGAYSLEASASFLCGFTPAAGASAKLDDRRLVLGFLDEKRHSPVTVALDQATEDGVVTGEIAGTPSREEAATIAACKAPLDACLSAGTDKKTCFDGLHPCVKAAFDAALPPSS
jgi:hypothetical protein